MTNPAILNWIESKPGPFVARTQDAVWRLAWQNFNEGPVGRVDTELGFMMAVGDAGFEVRTLAIGGCVLDKVN